MKIINISGDTLCALCKVSEKWGMYISFVDHTDLQEIFKAAPYLNTEAFLRTCVDGCAYTLFDTEEEMMNLYHQTVGDDGPTKLNPYNGPARVYALTCDPQGNLLTENT
jgi:hypothetical protein